MKLFYNKTLIQYVVKQKTFYIHLHIIHNVNI